MKLKILMVKLSWFRFIARKGYITVMNVTRKTEIAMDNDPQNPLNHCSNSGG